MKIFSNGNKDTDFGGEKQTSVPKTPIEAAGGAVISTDGLILMMLRRGMWDLPKGHRERGETLRQCAAREACEECGLDPELLETGEEIARTVHSYWNARAQRHEEKHTVWFRMTYRGDPGATSPQSEEDITELRWMMPADAREHAATSYETIRDVIAKLPITN